MILKILAQNILDNPKDFTAEEIEKSFEDYAKLRLFEYQFGMNNYFKTEEETVEEDYADFNNEPEPLMRWRKFDPKNIPIGDTFWCIDDLKSSVSYHHGYYWYKEGIYSYLILSSYDGEVEHLSPSMLVERNAHWISPYDIGF